MKRFIVATILLIAAHNMWAENGIDAILNSIEENNIELRALRHEHRAEVLDMKANNAPTGPSVEYSPFYQKGYTGMAESELVVSQEIDFPTKYADRKRMISLKENSQDVQYRMARRDVLLEAKLTALDVIRLNQKIQMLQERKNNSEAIELLYIKRMEAGDVNILELNKVKIDRMDVDRALSEAETERTDLMQKLREMNGGLAISLDESLFPEMPMDADPESLFRNSTEMDAAVLLAEAEKRASDHEVKVSGREWLPNLSVGYRRNTAMREQVNGFMVGASFPIWSTKDRVKAAKERRVSAEMQLQQARTTARNDVETRYRELQRLQSVLSHSDVKMMEETILLLNKALQHGEMTALQYYTEVNSIYDKLELHIDIHCQSSKIFAELHKNDL